MLPNVSLQWSKRTIRKRTAASPDFSLLSSHLLFGRCTRVYITQINAGEKVDRVKATAHHEHSAGVLDDDVIESALTSTVPLIQVSP